MHNRGIESCGMRLVSRPVQAGLGLFTAVLVYSAAFGGLGRFSAREDVMAPMK